MFEFTKWYVDAVDDEGRSAVAYWANVRWGPLAVRWEALSIHEPGREPVHHSGVSRSRGPVRVPVADCVPPEIAWASRSLSCDVRCRGWVQPFKTRLLDTPAGILEWRCEAPAASVSIAAGLRAGEAPIHRVVGFGYAECLLLTVVPWALPISELRWGRWISPSTRRSIAWVDWRGSRPLTVVLLDGVPALDAHVDDDRIRVAGSELVLSGTETLHARALGDLLAGLGPIAACVPAAWRSVEDRKSRSVGTCRPCAPEPQLPEAGSSQPAAAETGWAIHETVRFP